MLINSLVLLAAVTGSVVSAEWLLGQDYFLFTSPRLQIYQKTHDIRETGFFYLTGRTNPPYLMSPGADHHFWWNARYRTNSDGFLGDTFSEPGRINLLFLGDSVTFGLGVQQNETYPELLRSRIPDAKAAILAAPGYNTDHEIQVLKDALKARKFIPDIVFLQFGVNDYDKPVKIVRRDRYYCYQKIPTKALWPPSGLYKFLLDHSSMFFRLNHLAAQYLSPHVSPKDYPDRYLEIREALLELRQLGQEQHFEVVFLNVPERREEDARRQREVASLNALFAHSLEFRPVLRNEPEIWFDVIHPNAAGHEIIAREVLRYLTREGLLNKG